MKPDFNYETLLLSQGFTRIAGVDEVGRGCLAGPVLAAAVILDPNNIPDGLDDSKKVNDKRREIVYEMILASSHVGIASISAQTIDEINILQASLEAMRGALSALPYVPDYALIDGNIVPKGLAYEAKAIIKGDTLSQSIAAASIVAKVTRDRMMLQADKDFPLYNFAMNKGYGSAVHRMKIEKHGACALHRMSFSPFKK